MEHGCCDASGFHAKGSRVEFYRKPTTGELVKIEKSGPGGTIRCKAYDECGMTWSRGRWNVYLSVAGAMYRRARKW